MCSTVPSKRLKGKALVLAATKMVVVSVVTIAWLLALGEIAVGQEAQLPPEEKASSEGDVEPPVTEDENPLLEEPTPEPLEEAVPADDSTVEPLEEAVPADDSAAVPLEEPEEVSADEPAGEGSGEEGGESFEDAAPGEESDFEGAEDVLDRLGEMGDGLEAAKDDDTGEKGILNRFVNFIRGKSDSGEATEDEASRETYRRVRELERFAVRNYERGRVSEAKKNLNDLITLTPYEAGYHLALGLCFRKEGRFRDAQKKYQDVLGLGGPKPLVHVFLAEALSIDGDKEKIFEHLKEAAVGGRNIIHDVQQLIKLEGYKGDTTFIKLALSLEKYEITSKRSLDPMTNPFPERSPFDEAVAEEEREEENVTSLTPEEQKKLLMDARKSYDRVQWYIKLEDEEKAMENYTELRGLLAKSELITVPMIKNDFQRLNSRMDTLEAQIEGIRLKFYYNQALAQLKRIREAFNDTEYSQVEIIYAELEKLGAEMEQTNARYKPVAEEVLKAGQVWVERTRVRQEFEANKPAVQGIVISPETKQVVVNGRILNQGEYFDDFLIQKVENNRVTFGYKGEKIPLVFRRY